MMKRLKQYLEENDISQVEFSRRMSVSQPTVWGWLSGDSYPAIETLKKMSTETGLTIDALLDHVTPRHAAKSSAIRKAV